MTRQKGANLFHNYVEKQVFPWRAKNSYIWCIYTWKSGFSHDGTEKKVYIWCIITFRSRVSHDAPKTLIFDALLRGKADFLMTRQKDANLLHYYVDRQVFSWRTRQKNSYIWCINTWKSRFFHDTPKKVQICWIITFRRRFSHDAPKILIFDAFIRGKTSLIMMRHKGANLLHYYVEKQIFSWRIRKQRVY